MSCLVLTDIKQNSPHSSKIVYLKAIKATDYHCLTRIPDKRGSLRRLKLFTINIAQKPI